jgi:hypothetical protein
VPLLEEFLGRDRQALQIALDALAPRDADADAPLHRERP